MAESAHASPPPAPAPRGEDPCARLDALRARGAARFDPVGLGFLEAMARRAAAHGIEPGHPLHGTLARALDDYCERFERAAAEAGAALARATARFPAAAEALGNLHDAGEFDALQRRIAALEAPPSRRPLAELLAHIAQHGPQAAPGEDAAPTRGELKSVRHFRRTLARLSADRQLSQALAQAPENAGPLNAHHLVLQSLEAMRAVAPGYLEQFMSYVDALLWLDQADAGRAPAPKPAARGERKRKGGAAAAR